ncbi:MAG: PDZ domain-containing protein [Emcibacteraceae bacterium]|nr:PDZ domain-containing protein [Emcibacteraceae bacterium]
MRHLFLLSTLLLLSACGTGQYGSSYRAYIDPQLSPDLVALQEDQDVNVLRTEDLDNDVRRYRENNFVVVGESAFNGAIEGIGFAKNQAEEVGATHVVISAEYTNTRSYTAYDHQDFYRTAYVNRVRVVDGKRIHYSQAVTVRDSVTIPYRASYEEFDQWAVFLVKSNRIHKLGLILRDLFPDERTQLGRNSGASIDLVLGNSPAFIADVVSGDALVAINGEKVNNASHAHSLIDNLSIGGETIVLSLIKNGEAKDITFNFNN